MKSSSIFRTLPLLLIGLLGVSVCTLVACLESGEDPSGTSEDQIYGGGYGYGGGGHGYGYYGSR